MPLRDHKTKNCPLPRWGGERRLPSPTPSALRPPTLNSRSRHWSLGVFGCLAVRLTVLYCFVGIFFSCITGIVFKYCYMLSLILRAVIRATQCCLTVLPYCVFSITIHRVPKKPSPQTLAVTLSNLNRF